jgi:hypothetical protein
MRSAKVLARRSRRGASLWFYDPVGLFVGMIILGVGGYVFLDAVPLWTLVAAAIAAAGWANRIHVSVEAPAVGTETTFWLGIPIRRRSFDATKIRYGFADDLGAPDDAHPDEIIAGKWTFYCRRADLAAQWLIEAQRAVATPQVIVRKSDDRV